MCTSPCTTTWRSDGRSAMVPITTSSRPTYTGLRKSTVMVRVTAIFLSRWMAVQPMTSSSMVLRMPPCTVRSQPAMAAGTVTKEQSRLPSL